MGKHFHLQLGSDVVEFTFSIYFSISKDPIVPQIFALLHQRPKFDLFQETLFCILAPSSNLVPKVVPVEVGQHLCIIFTYFY